MSRVDPSAVRVLQVTIGDGNFGGVANFLYSFYSQMDHARVHFDFLYCGENSLNSKMNTSVLQDSTVTVLHALKKNNNGIHEYLSLVKMLRRYLTENQYDIIHINSSNLFLNVCVLKIAHKKSVCIPHSHNTKSPIKYDGAMKRILKELIRRPCQHYLLRHTKYLFACGKQAGIYLYGDQVVGFPRFRVIHNAIDLSKYAFNKDVREKLRRGYEEHKLIFGAVGRLSDQKNPLFLIDIFAEIHKKNANTVLWIAGDGELRDAVQERIRRAGLEDCVCLLGVCNNIPDIMQAMDALLLPSLFEGLAFVTIEAQAAGLPVFASQTITEECAITDMMHFISLEKTAKQWANEILALMPESLSRRDTTAELKRAGYELKSAAHDLEQIYLSIAKECDDTQKDKKHLM